MDGFPVSPEEESLLIGEEGAAISLGGDSRGDLVGLEKSQNREDSWRGDAAEREVGEKLPLGAGPPGQQNSLAERERMAVSADDAGDSRGEAVDGGGDLSVCERCNAALTLGVRERERGYLGVIDWGG